MHKCLFYPLPSLKKLEAFSEYDTILVPISCYCPLSAAVLTFLEAISLHSENLRVQYSTAWTKELQRHNTLNDIFTGV